LKKCAPAEGPRSAPCRTTCSSFIPGSPSPRGHYITGGVAVISRKAVEGSMPPAYMFFGYRTASSARDRAQESLGPGLGAAHGEPVLREAVSLSHERPAARALLRLEAQYAGLPVDRRRLRISHRPSRAMRLDMAWNRRDAAMDVIRAGDRLEAFLARGGRSGERDLVQNPWPSGSCRRCAPLQAQALVLNRRGRD